MVVEIKLVESRASWARFEHRSSSGRAGVVRLADAILLCRVG